MKKVKAVIGANWGDEGKGLMTDFFCYEAFRNGDSCINVCTNGGAQRGHTVVTPSGVRHVFHHFGSGTFAHADTYLPKEYILNPMTFCKEWEELNELGYTPKVYVHPDCTWSTPYDMMINQIIEDIRDKERRGSCGMGIWETVVRTSNETPIDYRKYSKVHELVDADDLYVSLFLNTLRREYVPMRLKDCGGYIPDDWKDIIYSDTLLYRFRKDIEFMLNHITIIPECVLNSYDVIVFENGQGLMIDQNAEGNIHNTTPSNTGIKNVYDTVGRVFDKCDVEVCYVTRTYATRHGVGELDGECDFREINMSLFDKTNVPNQYQGSIRYGKLDVEKMLDRVENDFLSKKPYVHSNHHWHASIAITHTNEYDIMDLKGIQCFFNVVYTSDDEDRNSVKKI